MTRLSLRLIGLFLLALPLVAAVPAQEGFLTGLPWWVWLVAIAAVLLLFFIMIVSFAWSSSREVEAADENE